MKIDQSHLVPLLSLIAFWLIASPQVAANTPENIQWASGVIARSSQYSSTDWSAAQALGAPNVFPSDGDDSKAWASRFPDSQREFIVLRFANPEPTTGFVIYETYNPGAVDIIEVRNAETGLWATVWAGIAAEYEEDLRVFQIGFPMTPYPVDAVRIELDATAVSGWNQIDAVGMARAPWTETSWWRNEPPSITPAELFVEALAGVVTTTRRVREYLHGIEEVRVWVTDPSGAKLEPAVVATRQSGDEFSSMWRAILPVPKGSESGLYGVAYELISQGGLPRVELFSEQVEVFAENPVPPPQYVLTKIAEVGQPVYSRFGDPRTITHLYNPPAINNLGTVAVDANLTSGSAILTSDGLTLDRALTWEEDGYALSMLNVGAGLALNDTGWIAFRASDSGSPAIFKTNGTETVLIDKVSTHLVNFIGYVSINDAGQVAYFHRDDGEVQPQIRRGDGNVVEVMAENGNFFPPNFLLENETPSFTNIAFPWILASGEVYYWANWNVNQRTWEAIFRTSGSGSRRIARAGRSDSNFSQVFSANARGDAAYQFWSLNVITDPINLAVTGPMDLTYRRAIGLYTGGSPLGLPSMKDVVSAHPASAPVINDAGAVAYLFSGIRTWGVKVASSGTRSHIVLRGGDFIDGRRVNRIEIGRQGFNARGQVALRVGFTGGHFAIYRADPDWGSLPGLARAAGLIVEPDGAADGVYEVEEPASHQWLSVPGHHILRVLAVGGSIRGISGFPEDFAKSFRMVVNGTVLGEFAAGDTLDFQELTGGPVVSFQIENIVPRDAWGNDFTLAMTYEGTVEAVQFSGDGEPNLVPSFSRTALPGETISINSGAAGHGPFSFQWFFANEALADDRYFIGTTGPVLEIHDVQASHFGEYTLQVEGPAGHSATTSATLREGVAFADWAAARWPGDTGPGSDPEGDGVASLLKYVFGVENSGDREKLPRLEWEAHGQRIFPVLVHNLGDDAARFAWGVEQSPTLQSEDWVPVEDVLIQAEEGEEEGTRVRQILRDETLGNTFYRLRIFPFEE